VESAIDILSTFEQSARPPTDARRSAMLASAGALVAEQQKGELRAPSMADPDDSPAAQLAELVVRARRGESAAYVAIHRRFARAVHAVALATAPFADVDDAVQEAFLQAWKNLPSLSEPSRFAGWMMQIARRAAIDQRRRRKASVELSDDAASVDAPPRAEAREVLATISTLPEAYRETLVMRLVEGMGGPEIAAAMGMTPDSVRVNLSRGMKMLREKLGAPHGGGGER
jgi:RNA polymerase sigma-70 factor (ECF subfamily)